MHDPEFAPSERVITEQTLPALQKLKDAGKVRQIGMTGYPLRVQKSILEQVRVDFADGLMRVGFGFFFVSMDSLRAAHFKVVYGHATQAC